MEEFSSYATKGRRTKRQRTLLSASASATTCGGEGGGGSGGGGFSDDSYGSSTSDEHDITSEVTTEEEDMANCLILLAQGVEKKGSNFNKSKLNINSNNNNNSSNNGNNNIGVYECKTCNKTFPSFQALGGHRTSHTKIKPPSTTTIPSPDHRDEHRDTVVDADVVDFTSVKKIGVQSNNNSENNNNNKGRVHECSICGSEFPSGQALGGHMRRHRAILPTSNPGRMLMSSEASTVVIDSGGPRNILSLDLNLPAPDDQDDDQQVRQGDHHMETKFVHVLPMPPPLVDCHY